MIHEIANLKLAGSILRIEIVDNNIYILDNKFVLYIYSNETFTLINKHILLDDQQEKHIYENTLAISKNLNFYHSLTKSDSGLLFTLKNDNAIKSDPMQLHKRDVSFAKFSPDSKLLLIGGEDGRSCFYDIASQISCATLSARSDFISSAAFSQDNKLVCIGAYDKSIKIDDINIHKTIAEVEVSDTPEDLLFLDDDNKVIGITRDRKIFSYSIDTRELVYANMFFSEWPTSIVKISPSHILVATKGDILYIFNTDELLLVRRFKVDNFGVKSLKFDNDKLYIGYSNGELKVIDTNYLLEEFKTNIKSNKFAKATSLMKDNIFLMTKDIAKKYDTVWPQVLDMAKDVLASKDVERAEKIVKPFMWDKRKKDEYAALGMNINDIKHFEKLIEQGSYVVAFKFADEKTHLKTTKGYETIETDFNKKFQIAKNLFCKDTPEAVQSAKNIITPYLKVDSKKDLINNLLMHYKVFGRSAILIKSRNFKVYFKLVEKNTFLKDESFYSRIVELGNQTYSKLLATEHEGNYDEAIKIAEYLEHFIPFTEKVLDIKDIIKSKLDLKELIQADDMTNIYNTIAVDSELELSSIFAEYHKKFEETKDKATALANEGKSPQVKETFKNHLGIEYLSNSIAMIFKLSYLVEIESAMKSDPEGINIQETMQRYEMLFGIDDELELLAKKLQFAHLIPDSTSNSLGYKENDFFDNVVIKTR